MSLTSQIESILFVASQPLTIQVLAKALQVSREQIEQTLEQLAQKYSGDAGIHLLRVDDTIQFGTHPAHTELVDQFVKDEVAGELTKAQLETLTIIAYRGPVTRPELEQIRGVNCALILRNLLIRGLIEEKEHETHMIPVYSLSFEALRHLGIASPADLPKYDELHAHEFIEKLFASEKPTLEEEIDRDYSDS